MAAQAFRVERVEREGGRAEVRVAGRLAFADGRALRRELERALTPPAPAVTFELSRVEAIDGGATALLLDLEADIARRGGKLEIEGASGSVKALVDLFRARGKHAIFAEAPHKVGILDQVGTTTIAIVLDFKAVLDFVGEATLALFAALRNPRSVNWRDVARITERAGADGLPIVALISLLVGLILGFQGAIQARQFGANSFVPAVVAIGLTRVLGPLMVAIIVTGRSGAAFAAEIGTMRVNEEVDALKTLGICPYRFLVFPRMLALLVAVPILTLLGDAIGLLGGFAVGIVSLDLSPRVYIDSTRAALTIWTVCSGLLMSLGYAVAIGAISCERGLGTTGGAEGVGRSTTSSVVTILFHLVVITFAFTFVYQMFDL
ncbi:MAG TPA: ABC transporter permease [Planctomycetota bacterium]|nr:ABC transporter permease [Planctomycetota bacterium]